MTTSTLPGACRKIGIAVAFLLYLLSGCTVGETQLSKATVNLIQDAPTTQRPDIILIVIDTLRRDHVGCYGNTRDTTPALDAFARQAVRLDNLVSTSSWTMPAVMSLFTAQYPANHRTVMYTTRLPDGKETLAGLLQKHGYQTAGIISNCTIGREFGFSRGFDFYDDRSHRIENEARGLAGFGDDTPVEAHAYITSPIVNRLALDWLDRQREPSRPFFLFLHYMDPHYSYIPPPPYDTMFDPGYEGGVTGFDIKNNPAIKPGMPAQDLEHLKALYDGEIRWTDHHIGLFLNGLKERGLFDDSFIVITADHGEEFLEHGTIAHGSVLYSETVNIPGLLKLPASSRRKVTNPALCSLVDLMPTICGMVGITDDTGQWDGLSLLDNNGAELQQRKGVILETRVFGVLTAIVTPEYKVVVTPGKDELKVFDLKQDPAELRPLASGAAVPGLQALLNEILNPYLDIVKNRGGKQAEIKPDTKTMEFIKAAGY